MPPSLPGLPVVNTSSMKCLIFERLIISIKNIWIIIAALFLSQDAGTGFKRQRVAILYERLRDCWNFSCAQKDNFVHIPLRISTYHRNFMSLIARINNKRILQILIDGNICHDELKVECNAHNPESVVW